jgi:hypothetical protein
MSSTPQTLLSPQDVVQPDDAHTLTQQAKDCLLANDIDGFEKALGKALEIDGNHVDALRLLADLCAKNGRHAEAIGGYRRILLSTPYDLAVLLLLGQSLLTCGDTVQAIHVYRQVLAIDPSNRAAREQIAKNPSQAFPPKNTKPSPFEFMPNGNAPAGAVNRPPVRPAQPQICVPQPVVNQESEEARWRQWFDKFYTEKMHDAEFVSWKMATEATAKYSARVFTSDTISNRMDVPSRNALLSYALECATVEGLTLEFGVHQGETINHLAGQLPVDREIHGFDSFEGLPDSWFLGRKPGRFSLGGKQPPCKENVRLHKGWFNQTLPNFLKENPGPFRFVHVDCDIYSSTQDILYLARDRFVPGTVLVFDEYFNYPGWEHHEFRAFQEFIRDTNRRYEYLAMAPRHCSVGVRLQ